MSVPHRVRHALRAWPAAAQIALIYLAGRALTTGFFLIAGEVSTATSRFGDSPSLWAMLGGWDAQWYAYIAAAGYPSVLPVDDAGRIAENAWAFMPVYPYLSAAVAGLTGSWVSGAVIVSLIAGYLCCVVFHHLIRDRVEENAALIAVAFLATGPTSVLFQIGYAEALFLLWLLLALWCVRRRRFGWLYLLIPAMGYTRPGVLAFALFLGLYGIWRWVHRRTDRLPVGDALHILATGALAVAVGFSWQFIAWAVTGVPNAYIDTELAWRRLWVPGEEHFVPFTGFVHAAEFWAGRWGVPAWLLVLLLVLVLAAVAMFLFSARAAGPLGADVRLFSASYLVYLVAVFFPQSSLFRLLAPLSPLSAALAVPRSVVLRGTALVAGVLAQAVWIVIMYGMGNQYWQVP